MGQNQVDQVDHAEFMTAGIFEKYCKKAGVVPSKRQASKFRRRIGAAWKAFLFSNQKGDA